MIVRVLTRLRERTQFLKRLLFILLIVFAAADVFIVRHEAHFFLDRVPAFWSMFGLAVSIGLAAACKYAAKALLRRDEDYYD